MHPYQTRHRLGAESPAIEFHAAYSNALGEDDFQLLINIVIRKYTMLEAAEELGISVEACKKRVQRAKKRLQKIIEKDF